MNTPTHSIKLKAHKNEKIETITKKRREEHQPKRDCYYVVILMCRNSKDGSHYLTNLERQRSHIVVFEEALRRK